MKQNIKKLNIINAPRELQLNNEELLNFMGGINCTSYDECSFLFDSSCGTFNNAPCSDGGATMKCNSYDD